MATFFPLVYGRPPEMGTLERNGWMNEEWINEGLNKPIIGSGNWASLFCSSPTEPTIHIKMSIFFFRMGS
jgi:hypothetical protein